MKLFEIYKEKPTVVPEVGATYVLASDKKLGDYAGQKIEVEKGPRGSGESEQYRVSWGTGMYDVDWIDTWMFNGSRKVQA